MIALPASGSSVRSKYSGCHEGISTYTEVILVVERVDEEGMRHQRHIEEVGEAGAVGLGDHSAQGTDAVEVPWPADGDNHEAGLPAAVGDLRAQLACAALTVEF
jgi:hypothetical protein